MSHYYDIIIRNYAMQIELNREYEELSKEMEQVVNEGFQEIVKYKRIHVSNIPFKYREADLVALFRPYGPVFSVEIIYNERGSKGFGFLTMYSLDADIAYDALNNVIIDGRKIEVNNATPRKGNFNTPHKNDHRFPGNFTRNTPPSLSFLPPTPTSLQGQLPLPSPYNSSQNYFNVASRIRPLKTRCNLFPE